MNQLALNKKTDNPPQVWAIETENSMWVNLSTGLSGDTAHLTFEVPGLENPMKAKDRTNLVSIAKIYNDMSVEKISGLAASIKEIKKIRKNDLIMRVADKALIDIGLVTKKSVEQSSRVDMDIEWKGEVFGPNVQLPLMTGQDVQPFHPSMLFGSDEPALVLLERKLREFGVEERREFVAESIAEYKSFVEPGEKIEVDENIVEVFFGTNRNRMEAKDMDNRFGKEQADELTVGFCKVSIPKEHKQGRMERPLRIWKFEFPEWPTDHIALMNIEEVEEDQLFSRIDEKIGKSEKKDILIFVHGFNTTFVEAARRTAQVAFDIPFQGASGFFSWPSTGKGKSYMADEDKAEASAPDFSAFLKKILCGTKVERLHIIAHSMGSRVLTFSLKDLSHDADFRKRGHIIQQIILGAPDIDQRTFRKTLLPAFKTIGAGRTLYSSEKDFPIGLSETARGGRPRLGDAGKSIFVEEGLDTIEASVVPTKDSHGYLFNTKEVLTDIFYLIAHGHGPLERRLVAVEKGALKYWHFPH